MRAPEIAKRLQAEGSEVIASTPEEYQAKIRSDMDKWAKVIAGTGIQPQ
jgi:tripartite-type tricarboxylate transporter receptor subunit TctC